MTQRGIQRRNLIGLGPWFWHVNSNCWFLVCLLQNLEKNTENMLWGDTTAEYLELQCKNIRSMRQKCLNSLIVIALSRLSSNWTILRSQPHHSRNQTRQLRCWAPAAPAIQASSDLDPAIGNECLANKYRHRRKNGKKSSSHVFSGYIHSECSNNGGWREMKRMAIWGRRSWGPEPASGVLICSWPWHVRRFVMW